MDQPRTDILPCTYLSLKNPALGGLGFRVVQVCMSATGDASVKLESCLFADLKWVGQDGRSPVGILIPGQVIEKGVLVTETCE